MKFGGSSIADAAGMRQVARLVAAARGATPLVVLSAMGNTTNALFSAARHAAAGDLPAALDELGGIETGYRTPAADLLGDEMRDRFGREAGDLFAELGALIRGVALLRELSPRSMDAIASFGERLSSTLFAAFTGATWFDARKVIRTNEDFGEAMPDMAAITSLAAEHLAPLLDRGSPVVTQGYIGATTEGLTTTLGRGGSDYSASLFGAALGAEEIQIWTDVEGVFSCDPRIVSEALPVPELSFREAAELAAFGAKVLHPATIQPAMDARIPVTVRHTHRPQGRFTTIAPQAGSGRDITALAHRGPVTVLTVSSSRMLDHSGFLASLFDVFGRRGISVDLVATAEVSVSLTVDQGEPLDAVCREIGAFATVEVTPGRAIIAIVGERLKATSGLGARIFAALGDINVEMISMGSSEINLSLVVRQEVAAEAVRRLHTVLERKAACV